MIIEDLSSMQFNNVRKLKKTQLNQKRSTLSVRAKHPVILLRDSHVTRLNFRCYHEKVQHQGRYITVNELHTSGYYVVAASPAVACAYSNASYVGSCKAVFKSNARPSYPRIEWNLPHHSPTVPLATLARAS